MNDKDITKKLKEALKGGTHNLRDVIEELGLHKLKSRNGTEELSIDLKTNKLYVCGIQKHKIISYHEPIRLKKVGLLSYLAEADGGKITGIFVGEYNELTDLLEMYELLKK